MEFIYSTPPELVEDIASAFREAFSEQTSPGYGTSGIGQAFFRVWMKQRGHAFFFLFKKNLNVTNIQFAELLALVSCHTTNQHNPEYARSLQFVSSKDFGTTVQSLTEAFPAAGASNDERSARVAELYASLLQNTVVVDPFHGSCSIYLPPHLHLDLRAVCGLSGYVHSCGRNVFVRNINKATKSHFFEALRRYLKRYPRGSKRIFFTVYAHEDFTEFDDEWRPDLRDGLDDIKIHVDKFFMGGEHLVEVLRSIRSEFEGQLAIPDPGDFRSQHQRLRKEADIDQDRTMWLITDYGVSSQNVHRSDDRYFICYDQLYDNKNPFQVFDENKPAWFEHTTTPHTLIAAMINVTIPYLPSQAIVIADPFVGTGTTWIEGFKYPQLKFRASDASDIACRAARDNAIFFAMDDQSVRKLATTLIHVAKKLEGAERRNGLSHHQILVSNEAQAESLANQIRGWANERTNSLDKKAASILAGEDEFLNRILFYIVLRTNKRHAPGLRRGTEEWGKAFAREACALSSQMNRLAGVKVRAANVLEEAGALIEYPGGYSRSVTLSLTRLSDCAGESDEIAPPRLMDARELGKKADDSSTYDVVVTDPPYGFNTDEGHEHLAALYSAILRASIAALKPDGQLVICLPERSSIGKIPMAFTQKNIVTHQVLALANEANKEVLVPARSMPGTGALFGPPFYWASERALHRSILHFRIRSRSVVRGSETITKTGNT